MRRNESPNKTESQAIAANTITAYMTLKGVLAVFRVAALDAVGGQTIGEVYAIFTLTVSPAGD
jgi:hypothetical protein